jgi:ABC-type branched-subunit amino acid transport system permease subunit
MKSILKQGLQTGLMFGIIFIFLILIGFVIIATNLIGGILGNLNNLAGKVHQPVGNLLLLTALIALFNGFTAQRKNPDAPWLQVMLNGLMAGLVSGLMVGLFIWGIGELHMNGTDFRAYLPNFGADRIRYQLFYSTPLAAAQTYAIYLIIFSLVGALIIKLFRWISQARVMQQTVSAIRNNTVNRVDLTGIKRALENKFVMIGVFAVIAIVLYFLPLVWGSYWNYIMGTVAIYILLGLGLNIIVGYSGQLVLGYVAFFATGAYTIALLTAPQPHALGINIILAIGIAVLVSVLAGLLIGLPILSLRGDYLAIVTLGFGEIVRILIRSDLLTPLTNGPKGVPDVGQPMWMGRVFSEVNYMHLLMLLVLVGLFIAKRLKDSRTGRAWIAIREDQTVAQATGVNTYQFKILALLLGAAFAGLSGALFASRNQFTGPEDFTLMVSVNVLCIVIVGGMGSLPGVILGAFVLKGLPELLRELSDYRLLVFGALLVVMMIVRPNGLWPVERRRYRYRSDQAPDINLEEVDS